MLPVYLLVFVFIGGSTLIVHYLSKYSTTDYFDFNFGWNSNHEHEHEHRKLSSKYDVFTNESIKTYNGHIPIISCPLGYYRLQGNLRRDTVRLVQVIEVIIS